MTKIKFESKNHDDKNFGRELRKRVRAYFKENEISTHANRKMVIKSIIMLASYLVPFILVLTLSMSPWVALGLVIMMGIGEAGIGMAVMHDAAHGSYSKKKWVNKLFASTIYLLGSNVFNWKMQHNVNHHTFTNIHGHDPDIDTKAVIRLSDHAPLKKYHRFQHLYAFPLYGMMTFLRLFGEIFTLLSMNKSGITAQQKVNPKKEMVKLIATKVTYLGLVIGLPLIFTSFAWWQLLIGFTALHLTAGLIMSTVFQMAHVVEGAEQTVAGEDNIVEQDWLVHELQTTSDFGRNNGILSWYIGGLDYQIEHHLFPNICHVHYPNIARIVEGTAKDFGYEYNLKPTFVHALRSHYRRLKELGKNS